MDTENIDLYIKLGSAHKDWYTRCRSMFIDLFGESDLKLVCNLFAATSINTSLTSNVTLFRRAYSEFKLGVPFSNYLPNIKLQLEYLRAGKELSGRKIRSFSMAMQGDPDAVVVDVWLTRAFKEERKYFRQRSGRLQSGGASDRVYTIVENWVRDYATTSVYTPSQVSAMIWAGVRIHNNVKIGTTYEDIVRFKFNNLFNVL